MPLRMRGFAVWMVLGVEALVGFVLHQSATGARSRIPTETHLVTSNVDEASIRERLIGVWQDEYRSKRTLTIRADGTATMVVQLLGVHRLFADRLTFEEEWWLEGDVLRFRILRGEPQDKIDFVIQLRGSEATQKILKLTDDQCLVFDETDQAEMDWRRVPSVSRPTTEVAGR